MKKILFMFLVAFVVTPVCFAQMEGNAPGKMDSNMMDGNMMNDWDRGPMNQYDKKDQMMDRTQNMKQEINVNWNSYSFDQRDRVVDLLKMKMSRIDEQMNDVKKSQLSEDMKRQQTDDLKSAKRQLDDLIKKVRSAKADNWSSVRSEVSNIYNNLKY